MNCPIREQTADGSIVGKCDFYLHDGGTCPRHGDVSEEVAEFESTGHTVLENVYRKRRGLKRLGLETRKEG